MRKREEAAIMHARWAAIRRRRMSTYPVLRRTVAVAFSAALISGSQDDPPACPPRGTQMTRATPPMTMAVSAPMTQAASRSVAAAASAGLGARGVAFVMRRMVQGAATQREPGTRAGGSLHLGGLPWILMCLS